MKRCMGCMEEYKDEIYICPYCGYEENTLPEESFHLTPGTVLGKRYQIGRVLGFGGFGVTYIGFDLLLEKKIAIKEYLPSEFATRMPSQTMVSVYSDEKTEQFELGMNKFVEEARKLAKFNETTEIVNVYDCLMENNTAYIIMEYLEGESLKQYLEKKKKLSVKEAEGIILPILRSLQSVHEAGLIHRDIAPDNIFLTNDGRVKLLDFGAARYASATHSRSLSVIYKPGYAPEEQYQSRGNQGPWTDVYALAATMYKLITGITPDTSIERRAKDSLKAPSKLGVDISKNQETALLNALNIQAKNRTQSTKQFLDEWESQGTVTRLIDNIKKVDVGKLSKKAKIAILSSIVAVGVIVTVALSMGGFEKIAAGINIQSGKTRVPSVINETMEDAQVRVTEVGLMLEVTGREYSSEIKKDLILNQSEQSGSLVAFGSKLGVMVSGGIRQIYMPEVSGKVQNEAITILEKEGFLVETSEEFSDIVAPGNIVRASITTGVQCDEGTAVIIYISKGADPATIVEPEKKYVVKNYVGMTVDSVKESLAGTGIYLDDGNKAYDDTVPAGVVISQTNVVGTELDSGSIIVVTVSLGKQMIRIPELTLVDKATAELTITELLKEQGLSEDALILNWLEEEYHPTIKEGLIISQSIEAGIEVEKGTVLNVAVSKGPEPTATPTPEPTATNTPKPTATNTPKPTATNTPKPTATNTPKPTATNTPKPTATNTPKPTATNTPKPTATNTPTPTPTNTPTPIPHEHDYSWDISVTKKATCTEKGRRRYTCVCGDYWTESISPIGHNEITVSGKAATCTTTGLTDGKKCSTCGTVTAAQQTIAAKGHSEVTVSGKAATCTTTGLTDGKKCSTCGTVTAVQQTIAAKGHSEVTVSGKAATCTATGLTDGKKCSTCGTVTAAQQTIAAKGHSEVTVSGKAATCTATGLTDGKKCSTCGTVTKAQTTIEAKGHSEVTVSGKAATCTATGLTDGKKCSTCGTVTKAQITIEAKGHSEVTVSGKAATCTATGLTDGKKCSTCGTVTVAQQTIAAKGHSYSNDSDLDCNNCGYVRGYWSEYGEWSAWQDTPISGSISCDVETQDAIVGYNKKTVWHYERWVSDPWSDGYERALEYYTSACYKYEEKTVEEQLSYDKYTTKAGVTLYGWGFNDDGRWIFWYNEEERQVDDHTSPIYKKQYRYRTRKIVFY